MCLGSRGAPNSGDSESTTLLRCSSDRSMPGEIGSRTGKADRSRGPPNDTPTVATHSLFKPIKEGGGATAPRYDGQCYTPLPDQLHWKSCYTWDSASFKRQIWTEEQPKPSNWKLDMSGGVVKQAHSVSCVRSRLSSALLEGRKGNSSSAP